MFRFWKGEKRATKNETFQARKLSAKKSSEKIPYRNFRLCILRDHVPSLINSESTSSSSTHSPHERRKLLCPIDCIALHQTNDKQTRAKKSFSIHAKAGRGDENKLRQRIKHRYELVSIVLTTLAPRPRNWLLRKFYCSHYRFIVIEVREGFFALRNRLPVLKWNSRSHFPNPSAEGNHGKQEATRANKMLHATENGSKKKEFWQLQFSHDDEGAEIRLFSWPFSFFCSLIILSLKVQIERRGCDRKTGVLANQSADIPCRLAETGDGAQKKVKRP